MLDLILEHNDGPFDTATLKHIFKEIFKAGLDLQEDDHKKHCSYQERKSRKIQLSM